MAVLHACRLGQLVPLACKHLYAELKHGAAARVPRVRRGGEGRGQGKGMVKVRGRVRVRGKV